MLDKRDIVIRRARSNAGRAIPHKFMGQRKGRQTAGGEMPSV